MAAADRSAMQKSWYTAREENGSTESEATRARRSSSALAMLYVGMQRLASCMFGRVSLTMLIWYYILGIYILGVWRVHLFFAPAAS